MKKLSGWIALVFGVSVLIGSASPQARAQGQVPESAAYLVTYIEAQPSAGNAAVTPLQKLRDASRKAPGNTRFDVLRRVDRKNHFAIIETWTDAKALDAHLASQEMSQFRASLGPLLAAPYDERPHGGFAVNATQTPGPRALYAVTHVDFIPPKKDDGLAAIKSLAAASAKDRGVSRYDVLQQSSRPNHVTLVETWSSQKALEAHEVSPHTRKFRDELLPMSGSLFDQRLYTALR